MLNDMKHRIGSDASNDRWELYEFSRRSGLPRGYFDRGLTPDGAVLIVCAGLLLALVACWAGEWLP